MPGKHSLLSPSSASRWIACPGSARATQHMSDTAGEAAEEGSLAHTLGEAMVAVAAKFITNAEYTRILKRCKRHKLYKPIMHDHCSEYATFIMEQFNDLQVSSGGKAELLLERRVDLSHWVPEPGNGGTTDVTIVSPIVLVVNDFKYGKGVEVSAERNKQMMLYALGSLVQYDWLYPIETVEMNIFQPRLDNYSHYSISVADLLTWAEEELMPAAKLAWEGATIFSAGDHCRFCKIRTTCIANKELREKAVAPYNAEPHTLAPEQLVELFKQAKGYIDWMNAVKDFMLHAAETGTQWPGLKLVRGRANRAYKDEQDVRAELAKAGYAEDDYLNIKIKGLGDIETLLGKQAFTELLGPHIVKPKGKATLVEETDPRTPIDKNEDAIADFEDVDLTIFN